MSPADGTDPVMAAFRCFSLCLRLSSLRLIVSTRGGFPEIEIVPLSCTMKDWRFGEFFFSAATRKSECLCSVCFIERTNRVPAMVRYRPSQHKVRSSIFTTFGKGKRHRLLVNPFTVDEVLWNLANSWFISVISASFEALIGASK